MEKKLIGKLITTDNKVSVITPKNNKNFTFKELYEILDCDMIELRDSIKEENLILVCNEDVPEDEPINFIATMIAGYGLRGNVVCCHSSLVT